MKILICLGNQILSVGVQRIITENLPDAQLGDYFCGPSLSDPDLVLFDSREKIDELNGTYPDARFICIDLGLKDCELTCLLLCHNVSGIISSKLNLEMFIKALCAVHRGEIWIEQTQLKTLLQQGRRVLYREDLRDLSDQDKKIIQLLARGLQNREIADQLCLSVPTVKAHLSRIYKTLNIDNRSQLVALATESGWQKPMTAPPSK